MNRRRRPDGWRNTYWQNLTSGGYNPLQRGLKVLGNVARRVQLRSNCCGNYGEPGC